jgi:gliding motility-associated-like protein
VGELAFSYLQPPLAGRLVAEVFPRLAEAEKSASFRYAVRLQQRGGAVRGFDRIEVDTGTLVTAVREVKLNGDPFDFNVDFTREDGFGISFALVREEGALLELTFDLPIFRFGTTFTGRAYNSRAPEVPQAFTAGNAVQFEPGDIDVLSDLSVAIPKPQIGKLVGDIVIDSRIFSPNSDGVNDSWNVFFNVLQLTRPAPVRLEIYDIAGHKLGDIVDEELGIGPLHIAWDGRFDGELLLPGTYIWVLRVKADAFEEQHSGTLGVVY